MWASRGIVATSLMLSSRLSSIGGVSGADRDGDCTRDALAGGPDHARLVGPLPTPDPPRLSGASCGRARPRHAAAAALPVRHELHAAGPDPTRLAALGRSRQLSA